MHAHIGTERNLREASFMCAGGCSHRSCKQYRNFRDAWTDVPAVSQVLPACICRATPVYPPNCACSGCKALQATVNSALDARVLKTIKDAIRDAGDTGGGRKGRKSSQAASDEASLLDGDIEPPTPNSGDDDATVRLPALLRRLGAQTQAKA